MELEDGHVLEPAERLDRQGLGRLGVGIVHQAFLASTGDDVRRERRVIVCDRTIAGRRLAR